MNQLQAIDPAIFIHVRTIISIIVGLSIGRLLTGFARFVQHPSLQKVDAVHFVWAIFMLVSVIHFWWWEFHLINVQWTFPLYCFLTFYASVYFFLCTMLFPDTLNEYKGFADYFMSRRKWFFGLLILIFLLDIIDTFAKGAAYAQSFGPVYWLRIAAYVIASAFAIRIENRRFQLAFALTAIVIELVWAVGFYNKLTSLAS